MNFSKFSKIGQILEHVDKRPGMYFSDSMAPVENFISGFSLAVDIFIHQADLVTQYEELLESHELKRNRSLYQQLREKGLDKDKAIHQLLILMIESYKLAELDSDILVE